MIYVLSVVASFVSVFLKGFQTKNIIGGHTFALVVTGYLMALFDVITISLIVQVGWPIALTSGTGAAFGVLASIRFHDRLFRSTAKEES